MIQAMYKLVKVNTKQCNQKMSIINTAEYSKNILILFALKSGVQKSQNLTLTQTWVQPVNKCDKTPTLINR